VTGVAERLSAISNLTGIIPRHSKYARDDRRQIQLAGFPIVSIRCSRGGYMPKARPVMAVGVGVGSGLV
jgi:hypothetical protein